MLANHTGQIVRVKGFERLSGRGRAFVFGMLYLLLCGIAISPLESRVWAPIAEAQPTLKLSDLEKAAGQGAVLGILGGMRALVADVIWIRMYVMWTKRNLAATEATIHMTVSADPRPVYFWSQGAKTIALDMPMWVVDELGGYNAVPEDQRNAIFEEFGRKGQAFLDEGLSYHPDSILLLGDKAYLYLVRMKDMEAASRIYYKMYHLGNGPYYAPRVYAELLIRMGRSREAYEFLRAEYPNLPNIEYAQKPVVLERIRALEDELGIPNEDRAVFEVEKNAESK